MSSTPGTLPPALRKRRENSPTLPVLPDGQDVPLLIAKTQLAGLFSNSPNKPRCRTRLKQQPTLDTAAILPATILTQLPLALKSCHGEFDAHKTVELSRYKLVWRVTHLPGNLPVALLSSRDLVKVIEKPVRIITKLELAVRLDQRLVPRRNDLSMFLFRRIPRRRYIGMRTLKDGKDRRREVFPLLPERIGFGEVTANCTPF